MSAFRSISNDFKNRDYYSVDEDSYLKRGLRHRRSISPPSILLQDDSRLFRDFDMSRTEPDLRSHVKVNNLLDASREATLKTEIYELQSKLSSKDSRIADLEMELRNSQEVESQQAKTIKHMHNRIEQTERDSALLSAAHSKEGLTIATLQADNRQLQDTILELENRIRKNLDEKDSTSQAALTLERNYNELKHFLCKSVFSDAYHDTRTHDSLMRRLKDFVAEDVEMRGRIRKVEDSLEAAEEELQKNRETVRKLLEDIDRTKRYIANTDILKQERDSALQYQNHMKEDLERMEERLLSTREAWQKAQHEIRQHQAKLGELDVTIKKHQLSQHAATQEFKAFKETLSTLLSDGYTNLPSSEEAIKDKIRQLMLNKEDVGKVSKHLEEKLKEVSKQLEEQAQLHKTAVQRARKAECDTQKFQQQLKGVEGELTATDILKDGLKNDKHKYVELLRQLAEIMRMDKIVDELGIDLNGDSLLLRAEQLVKMEDQAMGKRSVELLGMQRQLKEAKKQMDSKDMHMDVLKKKLSALESTAEQDWEDIIEKNKKLARQVDKLARQLNEARQTIQALKTEGVENQALKITNQEQRKTLFDLERKVSELDQLRTKQARKIAGLKYDKEQTEVEATHGFQVTETTMQSLSNELQRVKRLLDDTQKREKQLLDLRHVMARMLGLDANRLAVPDFEIISRLEKLIESQHEMALDLGAKTKGRNPLDQEYLMEAQRRIKMRSKESIGTPTRKWKY